MRTYNVENFSVFAGEKYGFSYRNAPGLGCYLVVHVFVRDLVAGWVEVRSCFVEGSPFATRDAAASAYKSLRASIVAQGGCVAG